MAVEARVMNATNASVWRRVRNLKSKEGFYNGSSFYPECRAKSFDCRNDLRMVPQENYRLSAGAEPGLQKQLAEAFEHSHRRRQGVTDVAHHSREQVGDGVEVGDNVEVREQRNGKLE